LLFSASQHTSDPFDLERFVIAQHDDYPRALAELKAGRKQTHWMWYVFPQMRGLGSSSMSQRYGISSLAEAKAYLAHPVLGPRLFACTNAVLTHSNRSASAIFGFPDDAKLHSSATLFARASVPGSAFERLLAQFFAGEEDSATVRLLHMPA
jgi:uncharacterized protein (DUF1810 family)